MKKLLSLVLALILCLSLVACGNGKGNDDQTSNDAASGSESESAAPSGTDDKKAEPVVYGNEYCGYVTIEDGIIRGAANGDDRVAMNTRDGDAVAQIWIETLSFSKEDPDFAYASDFLHGSYYRAYNGPDKIYSNEAEYEITLDGSPALKITAEKEYSKGSFDKMYCVGYVTTNASGGYVEITVRSPYSESSDIETTLPSVEKLAELVEKTYRKVAD